MDCWTYDKHTLLTLSLQTVATTSLLLKSKNANTLVLENIDDIK